MKRNMIKWLQELKNDRKALPILSFPSVSLLGVSVRDITSDSKLQAEGMKMIADKVPSAASVSFMDLSVEAECFGAKINFSENEVPTVVGRLINDEDEAEALEVPKVGTARSGLYIDAIKKARELITDRPVIAGMIGPFSLAARLFDVSEIMIECYEDPDTVHTVVEKATEFLVEYAKAYKEAGADGIMMAEPVSGMLSLALEDEFSAPYVKKIVDAVQDEDFVVIYHNCGDNVGMMTESILSTGAAAYHFGNSVDMKEMLEKMPSDTVTMGNVDPVGVLWMGNPATVEEKTREIIEKCAEYPNFILSSGCDMPPNTPWDNIEKFFEIAAELK